MFFSSSPFPKYCSPISSIHFYSLISISSHCTTSVQFLSRHLSRCLAVLGTLYLPLEPTHVSRGIYCWALKSLFMSTSAPAAFLHSDNSAFSVLQNSPRLCLEAKMEMRTTSFLRNSQRRVEYITRALEMGFYSVLEHSSFNFHYLFQITLPLLVALELFCVRGLHIFSSTKRWWVLQCLGAYFDTFLKDPAV